MSRQKQSPEQRREQILQAAGNLFAEQGFAGTTTKEIARAADIAEGTIYKYFASKQEILFAMVKSQMVGPLTELFAEREGVGDAEIIKTFVRNDFENFARNHKLIHIMFGEVHHHSTELMADYYQSIVRPALQMMEQYITRRIEAGVFRHVNPAVAVRALIGTLRFNSLVWEEMFGGQIDHIPREELIEEITAIFLRGMLKDPGVGE
jgi:AcrR family transcriptional regulator